MNPSSFEEFEQSALARGFESVVVRNWPPGKAVDLHTHDFALHALMVSGDLWLTVDGHTRHLQGGEDFELAARVPHAERYGEQGATLWVARHAVAR